MDKDVLKTAKGFATGTILGAAVGAIIALLFAPKSGAETRKILLQKLEEVKRLYSFWGRFPFLSLISV